MKSPQSSQGVAKTSIADVLAEASLKLDEALATFDANSSSRLAVSRLRALADNTSCLNTGCGAASRRAADTSSA